MQNISHTRLARTLSVIAVSGAALGAPSLAQACSGSESLLGTVCIFAGNFAPRGYAFTDGQLLPISSNAALFSILGTTYGGDGRTTFGLPDTRGRVVIGARQGPGLSDYRLGQRGGSETVALTLQQMPAHGHSATSTLAATAFGQSATGNQDGPGGNSWAAKTFGRQYSSTAPNVAMAAGSVSLSGGVSIGNSGGGAAHENRMPYVTMNYIIALVGIFPSRQ